MYKQKLNAKINVNLVNLFNYVKNNGGIYKMDHYHFKDIQVW